MNNSPLAIDSKGEVTTPTDHEKRRQRLSAQTRIEKILAAAQQEFIDKGYTATRMDDIAQRSGLSKGGLYAHFQSKDAVFEALMRRVLVVPDFSTLPDFEQESKAESVAEWLVDQLYATLLQEQTISMFRLLIAEAERIPHVIEKWYEEVVEAHLKMLQSVLSKVILRLGGSSKVLIDEPWLTFAPVIHVMIMQMLLSRASVRSVAEYRAGHIALLTELLTLRKPHR